MKYNFFDSIPSNIGSGKDNVFSNFLQTNGLYDSIQINEDNIIDLIFLLDGKVRISDYCKECKEERVFTMKPYIYFSKDSKGCSPHKLSERLMEVQRENVIKNTP